jgi:PAS domain S-box-containing protein
VKERAPETETQSESALQALLESAERQAHMGSWGWTLDTDHLWWSDNLYRIFGVEPKAITPSLEYVLAQTHPDDRSRVEIEVEAARRQGQLRPLQYRILRPDGVLRHLRASQAIVEDAASGPRRIVGSIQDVTDRRLTERTIAGHLAVAEALADWRTFERGATGLLRNLAGAMDAVAGVMWVPQRDVLVAQIVWRGASATNSELESVIRQLRLPRGAGLAGEVWESAMPRSLLSIDEDPRFSVEAVAGLQGAVAVPATYGEEVLAVFEFYFGETMGSAESQRLLRSLTGIGQELGEFLAHRRGQLKPLQLTPRELEVLQLAAHGCGGRQIAEHLVLSPATVRTHFARIYDKYGVSDRAAAVAKALRDGLID